MLCTGDLRTAGRLDDGCCRSGHPGKPTVAILCELGPPTYAITGTDGYELSDRWQEALKMRDMIRALRRRIELEDR